MYQRWDTMLLASIFILCPLPGYCDDLAHQVSQKQLEISRVEQQISNLNQNLSGLESQKRRLQSELDEQQALILDLGRQMVRQQVEATEAQLADERAAQEIAVSHSMTVSQLNDQIVKQQAVVSALSNKFRQQREININSDALNRSQDALREQQNILRNLYAQFHGTQAQNELERNRRQEHKIQSIVNQKAATQALEHQEKVAKETYEKLQHDLKSVQDQTSTAQADLQRLEVQMQNLANEVTDLNKKVS